MTKPLNKWELDKSQIKILRSYEAKVIGENAETFSIEFADRKGEIIEAELDKKEFKGFPYTIEPGTWFGIVIHQHKPKGLQKAGAWPLMKFWHASLREEE